MKALFAAASLLLVLALYLDRPAGQRLNDERARTRRAWDWWCVGMDGAGSCPPEPTHAAQDGKPPKICVATDRACLAAMVGSDRLPQLDAELSAKAADSVRYMRPHYGEPNGCRYTGGRCP